MIIITTDGSIVNFDNVTDIRIYHNADGEYEINAFLPFMNQDSGEYGFTEMAKYSDEYKAKREIDRIVYSNRNKRDIHVMVHDEDDDDEIIADIGELNENDE